MRPTLETSVITSPAVATAGGRILLIDDEPGILNFVSRGLQEEGYAVDVAANAEAGLKAALEQAYDLIILDLLLPDRDGADVLRELVGRRLRTAIIILSAINNSASKVSSFDLGADDYLAKPFSMEELLARIRVSLRHARAQPTQLIAGGLMLDLITRQVQTPSGRVVLAEREFRLLRELLASAGETLSKEHLLAAVWGYRFDPGSNVVDVYVRRLRAKIGNEVIKTIRGEGYRIDAG
jgi:two-component system, OmpR family, response regulator